jgi:hypothetical protein
VFNKLEPVICAHFLKSLPNTPRQDFSTPGNGPDNGPKKFWVEPTKTIVKLKIADLILKIFRLALCQTRPKFLLFMKIGMTQKKVETQYSKTYTCQNN